MITDLSRLIAAALTVVIASTLIASLDVRAEAAEVLLPAAPGVLVEVMLGAMILSAVVVGAFLIGRRLHVHLSGPSMPVSGTGTAPPLRPAIGPGLVVIGAVAAMTLAMALDVQIGVAVAPVGVLLGAELLARPPGPLVWSVWVGGVVMWLAIVIITGLGQHHPAAFLIGLGGVFGLAFGVRWMALRVANSAQAHWEQLRRFDARRRAEWIHDHLLSEVSHTILAMRARPSVDHEAVARLQAMDHRLRMVQLDEVLSVGPTRVASILQPHLRWAEAHGLQIGTTPSSEDLSARVDPTTGQMLSHVLSVLLSNAANAGAGSIGLELTVHAHEVTVALHDDAGGFDLAGIPIGRALEELQIDLGGDRIHCEPRNGGSVVTVRVPRGLLIGRSGAVRRSVDRVVG